MQNKEDGIPEECCSSYRSCYANNKPIDPIAYLADLIYLNNCNHLMKGDDNMVKSKNSCENCNNLDLCKYVDQMNLLRSQVEDLKMENELIKKGMANVSCVCKYYIRQESVYRSIDKNRKGEK